MFQKGQIVYHDFVYFKDGKVDGKIRRPCVVLFSLEHGEKVYVCTCPFTSQVKTFNKRPYLYKLIGEQIYSYKKLSFANLESTHLYPIEETHLTPYTLSEATVNSIIEAIFNLPNKDHNINTIISFLTYDKLFRELEQREMNCAKNLEKIKNRQKSKAF